MPNPMLSQARQMGTSIYRLMGRSESPTAVLSSGALASIAIAGSVFFFLIIVGPILIRLAKRRGRHPRTEGSITSLSSAEHGQLSLDENFNGPRRLRKRSVVSDGVMYFGMKDATPEVVRDNGGGGRVERHLSLPVLPPAISRPESFRHEKGVGHDGDGGRYENKIRPGAGSCRGEEQTYGSPEKRRGHAIYQNRRKTSWIDEDALHGPRVAPKDVKRKSGWFPGRGLTRTLSRHLSIRRFYAPELNRSPTLPCIETGPGRDDVDIVDGTPRTSPESRKTGHAYDSSRARELKSKTENETEIEPRFPIRQPLQQGGSLNSSKMPHAHVQMGGASPQRASVPNATPPYPQNHNVAAGGAARQLAGQSQAPSFDIGIHGQRYSRWQQQQQNSTDKELQAILRRTAERLQDGNRSTRRQTLMLPASSSPARVPGQTTGGPDQDGWYGKDQMGTRSAASSPARSQKSAPAIMLHSEPEGGSLRIQQGPSQSGAPWQTHRRTYTREISHISQIPQISSMLLLSRPDNNLAATPTRRRSQADMVLSHGMLPSPSRSIQTPPSSRTRKELLPRSYSPVSEQSSVLSTVYSEEEDSPPPPPPPPSDLLPLETNTERGSETERQAMAHALRASEVFCGEQTPGDDHNARAGEEIQERQGHLRASRGPRPLHKSDETLEHNFPNSIQINVSSPSAHPVGMGQQPAAKFPPQAISTTKTQDPFTTCTTPNRLTPQRLSQFFSPLPDTLPRDPMSSSADMTKPHSGTPTPSPSRRRVIHPPYRLRPGAQSPTLGHYHDAQSQAQSRAPSPVESESGLSSVYDSYRYSRYSDTTMLTVPPVELSPTKGTWDQTLLPATSAEDQTGDRGMESSGGGGGAAASRSAHVRLHNALSGAGAYTHLVGPIGPSTMESGSRYTTEDALPRSEPHRDISCSAVSCLSGESAYSQDDDGGDKLAPLMPIYSATAAAAAAGKHSSRVMNAVAELRRMNSQVSCVSAYSTATTNVTSPTLPALRGGGCSPGKRGTVGAAKNYFSLGNSPSRSGDREDEHGYEERGRLGVGGGGGRDDDEAQIEKTTALVRVNRDSRGEYIVHNTGGPRRSRRNTVVESYEQDLDRARQVLRQSRGYNLPPAVLFTRVTE
ncbi:hypothetical protein F4680DRAFT_455259 [Xylaria scruposa]|nr:hypothetical protein F4680DRAFT_455259 [Xylaria scruposa]